MNDGDVVRTGRQTVRGYSFFGDSYVYVIFDEDAPTCIGAAKPSVGGVFKSGAPSLTEQREGRNWGPEWQRALAGLYLYAFGGDKNRVKNDWVNYVHAKTGSWSIWIADSAWRVLKWRDWRHG